MQFPNAVNRFSFNSSWRFSFASTQPLRARKRRPSWRAKTGVRQRVDELLKEKTLEEKIGQLNQISAAIFSLPKIGKEMVRKGEMVSFSGRGSAFSTSINTSP